MKPEAQIITIAAATGWVSEIESEIPHRRVWYRGTHRGYTDTDLPDYLNDRNATFEAAQQLGEPVIKAMRFWLFKICGEMKAHHATAAQESEAIVRSLGQWVEDWRRVRIRCKACHWGHFDFSRLPDGEHGLDCDNCVENRTHSVVTVKTL